MNQNTASVAGNFIIRIGDSKPISQSKERNSIFNPTSWTETWNQSVSFHVAMTSYIQRG